MPQIADITVKKADGTTDVVYKAITPAAGTSPAVWKNQTVGVSVGQQPELRCASKGRTNKGTPFRDVSLSYKYPKAVQNTTTGELSLSEGFSFSGALHINTTMPQADVKEAAYQLGNLIASALIKSVGESGYAPY